MPELMDHRVEDRFLAVYERYQSLNGTAEPLSDLSKKAIECFAKTGFPRPKNESWKYTNVTPVIKRTYKLAEAGPASAKGIDTLDTPCVAVFVNGRFAPEQSRLDQMPAGVSIQNLSSAAGQDLVQEHLGTYANYAEDPFAALNTAFIKDGAVITARPGTQPDHPIHILHVITCNDSTLVQPRTLVYAGSGASLQILQSTEFAGSDYVLINAVTEIHIEPEAQVDYLDLQLGTPRSSRITNLSVYQEAQSKFYSGVFTFGGELTRNNLSILPNAEHCESLLHGLFMAHGRSHIDNNTLVDHAKPNCYSSEYYKGILDDHAIGVFNGKVLVRQDAQLTNAYQTNRSILLTETARMYSKPALEIYADDVKCSHGATTGQLDKDGLFYLRSRGIPEQEARRLMLMSFAGDIIEKTPVSAMHETLYDHVEHMLR